MRKVTQEIVHSLFLLLLFIGQTVAVFAGSLLALLEEERGRGSSPIILSLSTAVIIIIIIVVVIWKDQGRAQIVNQFLESHDQEVLQGGEKIFRRIISCE